MPDQFTELLELLTVERLEENLFRGTGAGGESLNRIFGGQVIAQALAAAYQTVPERLCHSLHAYFLRPGDPNVPVIYEVDRARDGGSFTTRRVVAIQHGHQILNMSASFHVKEEGWDHQHVMPAVAGPEGLQNRADQMAELKDRLPESFRESFLRPRPFEFREVEPRDLLNPVPKDDANQVWFRMVNAARESQIKQQILLAYTSDMYLLGSSLYPHGLTWFRPEVMTASLDHAMWFHAPIHLGDWHLYSMDAPFTGGGRGFNRGAMYRQDGTLVASVAQEGLIRPMKPKT